MSFPTLAEASGVLLAAPQPEPNPNRGNHTLVNVNIVKEVMNRNNPASRISLPHG